MPPHLINQTPEGCGHVSRDIQILVCASYELCVVKIFTVHVKYVQGVAGSCLLKVSNGGHLVKL